MLPTPRVYDPSPTATSSVITSPPLPSLRPWDRKKTPHPESLGNCLPSPPLPLVQGAHPHVFADSPPPPGRPQHRPSPCPPSVSTHHALTRPHLRAFNDAGRARSPGWCLTALVRGHGACPQSPPGGTEFSEPPCALCSDPRTAHDSQAGHPQSVGFPSSLPLSDLSISHLLLFLAFPSQRTYYF